MATYEARRNLLESASVFEVTGDALTRSLGGVERQRVNLADVRRVRITYQAVGVVPMWLCWVQGAHGSLSVSSASYTGFGRASDQRAAFGPFLQALTRAIAAQPHAQPVTFVRGGGWQRPFYMGSLILLGLMSVLLGLGAMGSLMEGKSVFWVGLPTIVVLLAMRMSWQMWRGNPPGVFDPNALPSDLAGG
ncbi:MAG TPA: hypothetical protein VGL58_04030 [Caulobacteraceae bacterium]|jgi:hypothetical protein